MYGENGGQGQNRTAGTGVFRCEMRLIIYYNQALIRLISYSSKRRLIIQNQ